MNRLMFTVVLLCCTAVACGQFDNDLGGEPPRTTELTFVTFNAGLSEDTAPWPGIRTEQLQSDLDDIAADVVCLQGVWTQEQVSMLTGHMKEHTDMTYSAYQITEGNGDLVVPAACSSEDVAPLMQCVMQDCSDSGENMATCVITNCNQELLALPPDCQSCMVGSLMGGGSVDMTEILGECMTEKQYDWAHDGNNGILLMSKHPMKDKTITMLDSFHVVRAAVSATITRYDTRVVCTGLTEETDTVEYGGTYDSWTDEQAAQAEQLVSVADTAETDLVVLMGDMRSNPAAGYNIFPVNESVWNVFRKELFYSPFLEEEGAGEQACTVCPENPLVDDTTAPAVPDHILFRERGGISFTSRRLFTQPITLQVNGEIRKIRISDHYGLSVTMTRQQ